MYYHLKRPDIKPRNKDRIAKALEMYAGHGKSMVDISRRFNVPMATVSHWLSKYWFYQKFNQPVTIKLKSKV